MANTTEQALNKAQECPNCKGYGERYESHGNGYCEYLACDLCAASYIRDAIQDVCDGGDVDRAVKAASQKIEEHYAAPQTSQPIGPPPAWTDEMFAAAHDAMRLASPNVTLDTIVRVVEAGLAAPNSHPVSGAITDEQIDALWIETEKKHGFQWTVRFFARAILSASGQAVSEKAVRDAALEEAAKVAEKVPGSWPTSREIRSLKSTPAQQTEAPVNVPIHQLLDWLETELSAIDTWYRGSPSYEHDAGWFKDRALKLVADARTAFQPTSAASQQECLGYADALAIKNFDKGRSDELSVVRHPNGLEEPVPIYFGTSTTEPSSDEGKKGGAS